MDPVNQYTDIESPASRSALRARLAEIDSELHELHARIEQLETARKPVANALDAIVYPILTLPVEITSEIFAHHFNEALLDVDGLPLCSLRTAHDNGPLILSQVCRAWRNIAINTHSMWCRVYASGRHLGRPKWRKLLESWLSRAGNQMLYLDLTDARHFSNLFPAVVPHSAHWQVLKCCIGGDWTSISTLVDTVRGRTPLLHEFGVWWKGPSDFTTTAPISAFSDAPELRKVILHYLPPEKITLPWAQLTHLTLSGQKITNGIAILHLTEGLEELSIDLYGSASSETLPVVLGRVHRLVLPSKYGYIPKALSCVTLPKLRSLGIGEIGMAEDADALLTFAKRSHCTLESVSLPGDAEQHLTMYALESKAIGIAGHVSVPDIDWSLGELEQFFNRIGGDSAFLPNMRSLYLLRCGTVVPFAALADMLWSRSYNRAGQPRLESFRLIQTYYQGPDHAIDPAIAEKLRALMDDGLEIYIEGLDEMGKVVLWASK